MANRRSGLTMVEMMISIAVLAFVLLAFLSIMHSASSLSASSREAALAARDLQSAVEETFAHDFDTFRTKFVNTPVPTPTGYATVPVTGSQYTHPLHRYWQFDTAAGRHRRPLVNQRMRFFVQAQDTLNSPPSWYEYRLECDFRNHKGFTQTEFLVSKRSR